MALIKQMDMGDGDSANYHNIEDFSYDKKNKILRCDVTSFKDQTTKDAGLSFKRFFAYSFEDKQFSDFDSVGIVSYLYNLLKQHPDFSGSQDG